MFVKIEADKPETAPGQMQCIAFKSGDFVFAGFYEGDNKAKPFAADNKTAPVFVIEEWMPIRIWA
jgi:hypothetical protein